MKKLALHWKIIIAMFLGILWSFASGELGFAKFTADWIDPFGVIFINCLKFIAVPLVMFSIITGIATLGKETNLGKMGARTMGFYVFTTMFAITTGLTVVNFFKPGVIKDETKRLENRLEYEIWANENNIKIVDGRNLLATADSAVAAKVVASWNDKKSSAEYAEMIENNKNKSESFKDRGPLQPLVDLIPENLILSLSDGNLMLQVIFFALFFGFSSRFLPAHQARPMIDFFEAVNETFIKMVQLVMKGAPFFVFCLMAGVLTKKAGSAGELLQQLADLGYYSLVVIIGLLFALFVFYPTLMRVFGVKIPYGRFFREMSPAMILAFSSSSSAAALPVTIDCVENKLGVPKKITDLVLPIGATLNMDGTSLYQAVAVIFLAQYHDVDLTLMQQMGIIITATLASFGAAAVPGAGLIMLIMVLSSLGLNPMWIAIISPVDRILDMCRTVNNVVSDAVVAIIVNRIEEKRLKVIPPEEY
jgi:Na+/H+-dicarboxylate symporter